MFIMYKYYICYFSGKNNLKSLASGRNSHAGNMQTQQGVNSRKPWSAHILWLINTPNSNLRITRDALYTDSVVGSLVNKGYMN